LILAAFRRIRIPEIVILLIAIALPAISQNAISRKKTDKPAVDALYQQGIRSLQKGDLAAARAAFERVVRLAPNAPEGHNSLGWVLLKTGNLDEAVAQLRTAVKLKPDFVQAHINLANALAARRDREGAIEGAIEAATTEARAAVKLAPANSEAHRTLGRLLSFR
jgi:protein O-GlcNAc transferase